MCVPRGNRDDQPGDLGALLTRRRRSVHIRFCPLLYFSYMSQCFKPIPGWKGKAAEHCGALRRDVQAVCGVRCAALLRYGDP